MSFRITITTFLVFCILAFLLGCMLTCNCSGGSKVNVKDSLHIDTSYILIADSMPWRQPEMVKVVEKKVPAKVDTAAILAKHFQSVFYKDTFEFKYGKITYETVVSENRVDSVHVVPHFIIPTYTVKIPQKKRNEVWIGVNGLYSPNTLAAGPSVEFAHKKGWGVNVGAYMGLNGQVSYGVGYKRKISFK
jgi:hypothetical protein